MCGVSSSCGSSAVNATDNNKLVRSFLHDNRSESASEQSAILTFHVTSGGTVQLPTMS